MKNDTSQQSFSGGKVQYSEVEKPSTSMQKVESVAAGSQNNPSGTGVPANKDYYPKNAN